jgi:hypothetical protein
MADQYNQGMFLPTTQVWDVSEIYSTDVKSPEFKELLVRLYQNVNKIATIVNMKDSALYSQSEFINGQKFFPNTPPSAQVTTNPAQRQVYRKVLDIGTLTTGAYPHGITTMTRTLSPVDGLLLTNGTTFTRIYGAASDPVNRLYIPLPYASNAANSSVEISVDQTNVNIVKGAAVANTYTKTYIILEYLKQ